MRNDDNLNAQYSNYAALSRRLRADGIYEEALDAHKKCLRIAQQLGDEIRIASCHFWIGECLYQLGRKEEAMMVLTPNLKTFADGSPDDLYNSMTKYIIIALDLPAKKQDIEDAIAHARQYLIDIGHLEWQHKLLYLEAELYQMQGKRERALELAIEGWAAWRDEYPLFVADAHLFQIAMFQIRLGLKEDVRRTVIEWETNPNNSFPSYRAAVLSRTRSHMARLSRDYDDAIKFAERAVDLTQQMQTPESLATMHSTLMWASMMTGDFETSRHCLKQIPLKIIRRKAVLIADYHLSHARSALGLAPVDIIFTRQFPDVVGDLTATDNVRRSLRRARKMYQIGLHLAKKFDDAFECSWRQDEIQVCIDHIDELEKKLL